MCMTSLLHVFFLLPHVILTYVEQLCVMSSTRVLSSCSSARKKWNCSKNRLSRFEQFHFLCRAVDFVKKVSRKRVSSNRISSRWSWPERMRLRILVDKQKLNKKTLNLKIIYKNSCTSFNICLWRTHVNRTFFNPTEIMLNIFDFCIFKLQVTYEGKL
jgi:hypothetical protein